MSEVHTSTRAGRGAATAAGKLPEVVLLAAMRKLFTATYSVAKHRRPFVPTFRAESVAGKLP